MPHRPWHTGNPFFGGGMYGGEEEFDLPALFAASPQLGNLSPEIAANAISSAVQQISASPSSPFQDFEPIQAGPGMGMPGGGGPMDMNVPIGPEPPPPTMFDSSAMASPAPVPAPPQMFDTAAMASSAPVQENPNYLSLPSSMTHMGNGLLPSYSPWEESPSDDFNLGTFFGKDSLLGRGIQGLGNIPLGGPSPERQEDIANLPANILNRLTQEHIPGEQGGWASPGSRVIGGVPTIPPTTPPTIPPSIPQEFIEGQGPGMGIPGGGGGPIPEDVPWGQQRTIGQRFSNSPMASVLSFLGDISGVTDERQNLFGIPFNNDPARAARGSITEGRPTSSERTAKLKEDKKAKEQEDKYIAQQKDVEKAWQDMMKEGSETERKTKLEEMEVKIKNSTTYRNLPNPLSPHDLSIVAANVLDKDPRGIANEGTITNEINTVIAKVPGATVSPKEEVSPSGSSYRDLVPAPAAEVPSVVSPKEEVEAVKAVSPVASSSQPDLTTGYISEDVDPFRYGRSYSSSYDGSPTRTTDTTDTKKSVVSINESGQNGDKFTGYDNGTPDLTTNYMTPESKSEFDDKNVWGIGDDGMSLYDYSRTPLEQFRQWRMSQYPGASLGSMATGGGALTTGFNPAYGRYLLGATQPGLYEGFDMETPGSAFGQYLKGGERRGLQDVRTSYQGLGDYLTALGAGGGDMTGITSPYVSVFGTDPREQREDILSATQAAMGMRPGMGARQRRNLGSVYDIMESQYGPKAGGMFSQWVGSSFA